MKNNPLYEQLRQASWRRKLTPAEEAQLKAWLAAHPEAQADWQIESALTDALEKVPTIPVPSNFTARVLQTAEAHARRQAVARGRRRFWHWPTRWLPRLALASVVVAAGMIGYHCEEMGKRKKIAESLVIMSRVPPADQPDVFENFEAVQALGQAADEDLIKLLQ